MDDREFGFITDEVGLKMLMMKWNCVGDDDGL